MEETDKKCHDIYDSLNLLCDHTLVRHPFLVIYLIIIKKKKKKKKSLVQVGLRTEVLRTPSSTQVGFELRPPDHDSTFHVTEMPALTTRPSMTSYGQ